MTTTNQRPIAEISGISSSAVVQLNRAGINTIADLLAADYEQVAVLMDCFDDAAKVIKEAKRMLEQADQAARAEAESRPAVRPIRVPRHTPAPTHADSPAASHAMSPHAMSPRSARVLMNPSHAASARIDGPATTDAAPATRAFESPIMEALSMGLTLGAPANEPHRATIGRRLSVVSRLLASQGSDAEPVAAVLLEAVEAGAIPMDRVIKAFGPEVARVLDEAMSIRAVPVSPSGRLPQYYMDMAAKASTPARRVCAAFQLWWLEQPAAQAPGASAWYAKLIAEALEAGEPNTLIAALSDRMRRRAA